MRDSFFLAKCQTSSTSKIFGLCDDPRPASNPAYIDEHDGKKWIAVVNNPSLVEVIFTAIDNCVETLRPDGKMSQRCDGVLTHGDTVIFVELKQRGARGNAWVIDAEEQLRTTVGNFKETDDYEEFPIRKAYISNSEHPKFKQTQSVRMQKFEEETGYVLRIENRISLE